MVKYNDLDKPNNFIVMSISDCDELYRIERIYRNNGYKDFSVGKLLDIRDNKIYQNRVIIGNLETIQLDNHILGLVKNQIQLEQEIFKKTKQLNHIDETLLYNDIFINSVYYQ